MNLFTKPLRQLRWKLALSYAGVSLLALLTVEVLLFASMGFAVRVFLNNGSIPKQLVRQISTDFVPFLQPHLSESPPNLRGIADVLALAEATTARTVPLSFDVQNSLVIGNDRSLLGSSPPDLLEEYSIGQTLNLETLPELAAPLQAALAGEQDLDKLYTVGAPGGNVVFAVPVWDAEQLNVLGVFVGITPFPTLVSLFGEAAPIVGVSLLIFTLIAGGAGIVYGLLAAHGPVQRIGQLAAASEAWGRGDFSVVAEDSEADEIGQLARRLNQMAARLEQLVELRQELAVLRERNRLARDLHDSVKQLAFAAAAQIGTPRTLIAREPAVATTHIEEAERLTLELRLELSSLILELTPPALENKGLASALHDFTQSWSKQNNIEVRMNIHNERRLASSIRKTIFRIAQEALANVARHSHAQRVDIDLTYNGNTIHCVVEDDGKGFDPENINNGFGLHSMADRAIAMDGELTVESKAGLGTRVRVMLPIDDSNIDVKGEEYG